jgi:hypothetical protein
MIHAIEQIERLELAASDSAMLAGLHWNFITRNECRREALAFHQAAQRLRGEQFERSVRT